METNPTILARHLIGSQSVMAKWRTSNLLEIFNCAIVDRRSIFLRSTSNCSFYVPIWVNITSLGMIEAFLDPSLNIISKTSPESDCRIHHKHFLTLDNELIEFTPSENKQRIVEEKELIHPFIDHSGLNAFSMDSFHDNIITNETEMFQEAFNAEHVDELEREHDWRTENHVIESKRAVVLEAHKQSVFKTLFGFWIPLIHAWWINICCIIVSIVTIIACIVLALALFPASTCCLFRLSGFALDKLWDGINLTGNKASDNIKRNRKRKSQNEEGDKENVGPPRPKKRTQSVRFKKNADENQNIVIEDAEEDPQPSTSSKIMEEVMEGLLKNLGRKLSVRASTAKY